MTTMTTTDEEGVLSWAHKPEGERFLRIRMNEIKVEAGVKCGRMPSDESPFPFMWLFWKKRRITLHD